MSKPEQNPGSINFGAIEFDANSRVVPAEDEAKFLSLIPRVSPDRDYETNDGKGVTDKEALELLTRPETHEDFTVLALTQDGLKPLSELNTHDSVAEIRMNNRKTPGQSVRLALSPSALFSLNSMVSKGIDPTDGRGVTRYLQNIDTQREI